jgi:hypothetical protein
MLETKNAYNIFLDTTTFNHVKGRRDNVEIGLVGRSMLLARTVAGVSKNKGGILVSWTYIILSGSNSGE